MVDIKWVKFEVGMYDDIKLKILDNMENRDLNQNVWAKSLVLAGKINRGGYLYITDTIPHTIKTLATEFNRSVEEIKSAYKILRKLEMIEFTADKVFKIKNWDKHQNIEGMERNRQLNNERVAKHRAKKKELNEKDMQEKNNNDFEEIEENNNEKINNIDIKDEENTSDFIEEESEDDFNNNNVIENNGDNNKKDNCNVTCNIDNSDCNVTVRSQNKKEKKNKIEKKKESKSDDIENKNISNEDVAKLVTCYESTTGILGGLNIGFLKLAIDAHGYKNVKMAINKAIEVNKANMTYINGILKNWRREGYPDDDLEVKKNGTRSNGKSSAADKNEFAGFKPKEPRKLTEEERRKMETNLI